MILLQLDCSHDLGCTEYALCELFCALAPDCRVGGIVPAMLLHWELYSIDSSNSGGGGGGDSSGSCCISCVLRSWRADVAHSDGWGRAWPFLLLLWVEAVAVVPP